MQNRRPRHFGIQTTKRRVLLHICIAAAQGRIPAAMNLGAVVAVGGARQTLALSLSETRAGDAQL